MLILDYLKFLTEGHISIAPFHTGHLGLFPSTEVSVSLLHGRSNVESPCELVITPFSERYDKLCSLSVAMKDELGVVRRLLNAVGKLGLNVVTLESSVMNCKTEHHVVMVLDWHNSRHNNYRETPQKLRYLYRRNAHRIPTHDWRYVLLYEAIMYECGDKILLDDAHGFPLPSITIEPFADPSAVGPNRVRLDERPVDSNKKKNPRIMRMRGATNSLQLPSVQLDEIRRETGYLPTEEIPTVMFSSTDKKSLRLFVPPKPMMDSLVHLGFAHVNKPGALLAITELLENACFNILTGILRKQTANASTFEVLLQYTGQGQPPKWLEKRVKDRKHADMIDWCFTKLDEQKDLLSVLEQFRVAVCAPMYPRPHETIEPKVLKPQGKKRSFPNKRRSGRADLEVDVSGRLSEYRRQLKEPPTGLEIGEVRTRHIYYLEDVIERSQRIRPRIFLSYPGYAKNHAKLVHRALSEEFELVEYQEPDYEEIVKQVLRMIRSCDYFVGIWHHERYQGATEASVSPWMPFEYGIAMTENMPCMITYSDQLPPEIWKRIDPGTAKEGYHDLIFEAMACQNIKKRAVEKWLPSWKQNWPRLSDVLRIGNENLFRQ